MLGVGRCVRNSDAPCSPPPSPIHTRAGSVNGTHGEPVSHVPMKILVLSRNYPNNVIAGLGLWVKRLVDACAKSCELKVISPVPYVPPFARSDYYARFRAIVRSCQAHGTEVFYPRFLAGPAQVFYSTEALRYYLGIRALVERIHKTFPFGLIHAHFGFPDGVVAAWLGKQYGIPVVVTQHALWRPNRMEKMHWVRRQAMWAVRNSVFQIAVSSSVKRSMEHFMGDLDQVRVIPVGVDGSIFHPVATDTRDVHQILYVGFPNYNKGVDLLLQAMTQVSRRHPKARLVLVGGSFYKDTNKQEQHLRAMTEKMGLQERVVFAGHRPPEEVAQFMRRSALLVLPSRAESFGAVLVEALASGIPVVATRCGGPEDIVTDEVGTLVATEDDHALALAIERVLSQLTAYHPDRLRAYALEHFSWNRIAAETHALYDEALAMGRREECARAVSNGLLG